MVPKWLKVISVVWTVVWACFYWRHYGPQNFLWFCDLGNFIVCLAILFESPLLFSWQAVSLLLIQILWTIDFVGALLFRFHLIGGSEYMFDSNNPLYVRGLSLFHVAVPIVLIWAIRKFGYDRRALSLQTMTAIGILPFCLFGFGPDKDINWVWGPFDKQQFAMHPWLYFALCMAAYPLLIYLPTHLVLKRFTKAQTPGV